MSDFQDSVDFLKKLTKSSRRIMVPLRGRYWGEIRREMMAINPNITILLGNENLLTDDEAEFILYGNISDIDIVITEFTKTE